MILGLLTLKRVDQLGVAEEDKHRMEKVWCLQLDEDEMRLPDVLVACALIAAGGAERDL